jgi:pimeloyl-ACP methyl ester carboxylesterase
MSTTGNRWKGQPALRVYPFLLRKPATDREVQISRVMKLFKVVGSPGFERDEADLRELAGAAFDRGRNPAAGARQLAAIIASGDRTKRLRAIAAPTLVIHGSADKLVRPSGGRATAKAINGAELLEIPGMGHDLPRGAWPQIIDAIVANAARA